FEQKQIGWLFAFIGVLIVLYQGGLVRMVSKRMPERAAMIGGLTLMVLGLVLLPRTPWAWPFLLCMLPLAWGSGMHGTATLALASRLTPADEQGGVFGVLNAMQGLGRILGPFIGTFCFAKWGYKAPYTAAASTVGLALVLALSLRKPAHA